MELATKSISFSFNDTVYWQVDGITIGSPLGSFMANVFVGFLEQQLFGKVHKPYYVRYLDDTFACFPSCNGALKFFPRLNNLHPSLTFTMEEENNLLPFLNMLVEKYPSSFITSIYWKPIFTDLYISWDSFATKSRKINFIKCHSHQSLKICSNSRINAETKKVTDIFRRNGYPDNVILSSIRSTISKFNSIKSFGPSKCPVYVKLPGIGLLASYLLTKSRGW